MPSADIHWLIFTFSEPLHGLFYMVYFILLEGPWKFLQDSSSRSPKSDLLFSQGHVKPRQVVF